MDSSNGELINKVTQGTYPPGSVFKIVVAAAALESGISPDKVFECTGSETINGHTVKCETGGEKGHGKISFKDAFAVSCNCAFIQAGQAAGAEAIIDMAERMGMGQTVLESFPDEQKGRIMSVQNSKGAAIANLSIGQGENLVTPLQVAAMTAIVANGGIKTGVKIVNEENLSEECISPEIAAELQKMMEETIISGTGRGLDLYVTAGAKTGSAESYQSGNDVIHGWITGYVPADNPQYVVTVFVEDGKSGRSSAGPLFCQLVNYMYNKAYIEYETDF
jgi:peptidoglycan glycosyltransferase/penicillin-binding protein 2